MEVNGRILLFYTIIVCNQTYRNLKGYCCLSFFTKLGFQKGKKHCHLEPGFIDRSVDSHIYQMIK